MRDIDIIGAARSSRGSWLWPAGILAAGFWLSNAALAQQTASGAQRQWLRVTSDNVNLRSRPDLNSLIVGRVSQGAVLESTGVENGWRVLVPPPGVFSIVAAQFVEMLDSNRGRVNVDTSLRVRVGSDIQSYDPMLCEVQTHLRRGDEVEIVGRLNPEWLKIKPPTGVYVYIAGEYVTEIPAEEAERLRENRTVQESDESAEPTQADVTPVLPPAVPAASAADLSGPWGQKLAEVQQEIERLGENDDVEPDWDSLTAKLRPIAVQSEEPGVAALAADWLRKIEQQAQDDATSQEATKPATSEPLRQLQPAPAQPAKPGQAFDATGILRPSFALPVGPHGLRYRLLTPGTGKVTAYIEIPADLGLNINECVEKYVGVKGTPLRLSDPPVTILRVTQLTVLEMKTPARKTP